MAGNMSRLKLPNVVLVVIDGSPSLPIAEYVIRECQDKVEFADTMLFSNVKPNMLDGRWLQASVDTVDKAMKILWYELPSFIYLGHISHVLIVQWDAGILDTNVWSEEFLKYDYIGAPWGWHGDGHEVGNGGFSLRSLKLMYHVFDNKDAYPFKNPEDDTLCREYRPKLEAAGFKWAPSVIASEFSVERSKMAGVNKHFGFHGIFNWVRYLPKGALLERIALVNKYVETRPEYQEVATQFLGLKPLTKSTMLHRNFPPS